jgi:hypothetical protein
MTGEYQKKVDDVIMNELTELFSKTKFMTSGIRAKINKGIKPKTMILGFRKWFINREYGLSANTSKNQELYDKLKELMRNYDPGFEFSSITINKNFLCEPHKDKGNNGESYIIGFGDYTGGELNIEGTKHDIKYKFLKFDGCKNTHWVEPFEGNRYTAIFFNHKDYKK